MRSDNTETDNFTTIDEQKTGRLSTDEIKIDDHPTSDGLATDRFSTDEHLTNRAVNDEKIDNFTTPDEHKISKFSITDKLEIGKVITDELETAVEKTARHRSHYVAYTTQLVMAIGVSIVQSGVWNYLKEVRPGSGTTSKTYSWGLELPQRGIVGIWNYLKEA